VRTKIFNSTPECIGKGKYVLFCKSMTEVLRQHFELFVKGPAILRRGKKGITVIETL
jgi:hypothetical protein